MKKKIYQKKRRVSKAHKFIINTITQAMFVLFWISVCSLDSPSFIPVITGFVSLAWLFIYAKANGYIHKGSESK